MADIAKILEDTAVELLRIAVTELPTEYVEVMGETMAETRGQAAVEAMAHQVRFHQAVISNRKDNTDDDYESGGTDGSIRT